MKKSKLIIILAVLLAVALVAAVAVGLLLVLGDDKPEKEHVHTYSATWSMNETYHWHAASCEHALLTRDMTKHTFVGGVCVVCGYPEPHEHVFKEKITPPTCTEDGKKENVCECGEVSGEPEILPALGHEYDDGVFASDNISHWHPCIHENCDARKDETRHAFGAGDTCTVCEKRLVPTAQGLKYVLNSARDGYILSGVEQVGGSDLLREGDIVVRATYDGGAGRPLPVVEVKEGAFQNNRIIKSVVFMGNVRKIGAYAFMGCGNLAEVLFSDSIVSIGEEAFANTRISLDQSNWKDGALYHGGVLLETNGALPKQVAVEAGTKAIADAAFASKTYDRTGLLSVELPSGLEVIGPSAFEGCSGLTRMTFPASLRALGERAFAKCDSLVSFSVDGEGSYFAQDGILYRRDGDAPVIAAVPHKIGGEITVANGVRTVYANTFENCASLEGVTLPDTVVTVGESAFFGCASLGSVELSGNLERLGGSAFMNCVALQEISLPSTLNYIGAYAFVNSGVQYVAFDDPLGWKTTDGQDREVLLEVSDLEDESRSAELLKSEFYFAEWRKESRP